MSFRSISAFQRLPGREGFCRSAIKFSLARGCGTLSHAPTAGVSTSRNDRQALKARFGARSVSAPASMLTTETDIGDQSLDASPSASPDSSDTDRITEKIHFKLRINRVKELIGLGRVDTRGCFLRWYSPEPTVEIIGARCDVVRCRTSLEAAVRTARDHSDIHMEHHGWVHPAGHPLAVERVGSTKHMRATWPSHLYDGELQHNPVVGDGDIFSEEAIEKVRNAVRAHIDADRSGLLALEAQLGACVVRKESEYRADGLLQSGAAAGVSLHGAVPASFSSSLQERLPEKSASTRTLFLTANMPGSTPDAGCYNLAMVVDEEGVCSVRDVFPADQASLTVGVFMWALPKLPVDIGASIVSRAGRDGAVDDSVKESVVQRLGKLTYITDGILLRDSSGVNFADRMRISVINIYVSDVHPLGNGLVVRRGMHFKHRSGGSPLALYYSPASSYDMVEVLPECVAAAQGSTGLTAPQPLRPEDIEECARLVPDMLNQALRLSRGDSLR